MKNPQAVSQLVHLAFNTSLIVSYSRPFHDSNDAIDNGRKVRVSLRKAVESVLDAASEQSLHKKITSMRDQAFAHSDAAADEFEGFNYGASTVQVHKLAFDPISRDETLLLRTMIGKWIDYLEAQRSELKEARGGERVQRA